MVFSSEFCEISKNNFFTEHLWTTASKCSHLVFPSSGYFCNIDQKPIKLNIKKEISRWALVLKITLLPLNSKTLFQKGTIKFYFSQSVILVIMYVNNDGLAIVDHFY